MSIIQCQVFRNFPVYEPSIYICVFLSIPNISHRIFKVNDISIIFLSYSWNMSQQRAVETQILSLIASEKRKRSWSCPTLRSEIEMTSMWVHNWSLLLSTLLRLHDITTHSVSLEWNLFHIKSTLTTQMFT